MSLPNVSSDLLWQVARSQNAYLVKRKDAGGVQFSRDPYNLANKNTWKHAGFVNNKALGIVANEKGGVQLISKRAAHGQQPAKNQQTVAYRSNKSARKTYKAVANQAAKSHYRPDLRETAVARASAILRSQRPVKPEPERKLRGNAAKKAAEQSA
ncbi:putative ribosomal protein l28e protein [Phialemonium atrogriseum]|uniref:Ribosomal protein l28e protein n=1 Tax=Phialemonium atrogriseum TaxID=1093897 RepID=A0AAJ0C359_9PEZI|nr:putative ribosomal protein l28e protein [Phialemonium atrogriseum]KAK1769298.1 putative ribosomal protein l28e protein [Phialemonium atrogriseum]